MGKYLWGNLVPTRSQGAGRIPSAQTFRRDHTFQGVPTGRCSEMGTPAKSQHWTPSEAGEPRNPFTSPPPPQRYPDHSTEGVYLGAESNANQVALQAGACAGFSWHLLLSAANLTGESVWATPSCPTLSLLPSLSVRASKDSL